LNLVHNICIVGQLGIEGFSLTNVGHIRLALRQGCHCVAQWQINFVIHASRFHAPEGSFIWREIGVFAITHHMKLNSFYFSREPTTQNEYETETFFAIVNTGDYKSDTLHVFFDSQMWEIVKVDTESFSKLIVLDSVPILMPAGF
jgi:hypothetical protein